MGDLPAFLNGENPAYGVPNDDGFIGVSPEYANFANDTDEPLLSDDEQEAADEAAKVAADTENSADSSVPSDPAAQDAPKDDTSSSGDTSLTSDNSGL